MAFDNAHAVKNNKKGYQGRIIEYDHTHDSPIDKGTVYEFISAEQLLKDFLDRINKMMSELENR